MTGKIANPGAFVFEPALLSSDEIREAADLARSMQHTRVPVHNGGRYADLRWYQVDLDHAWPIAAKMLGKLGATDPEMVVFYYLEPGAVLHPHRDLTGASLNNRLRFHVPIVTHEDVEFRVNGRRVRMEPGDLWCLDTSYVHSVHNNSDITRVHMIVECEITPQIRAKIPNNMQHKLHSMGYAAILASKFVQAIVVNSVRDPAYLRAQMGMVGRFIGWRFLGKGRAS